MSASIDNLIKILKDESGYHAPNYTTGDDTAKHNEDDMEADIPVVDALKIQSKKKNIKGQGAEAKEGEVNTVTAPDGDNITKAIMALRKAQTQSEKERTEKIAQDNETLERDIPVGAKSADGSLEVVDRNFEPNRHAEQILATPTGVQEQVDKPLSEQIKEKSLWGDMPTLLPKEHKPINNPGYVRPVKEYGKPRPAEPEKVTERPKFVDLKDEEALAYEEGQKEKARIGEANRKLRALLGLVEVDTHPEDKEIAQSDIDYEADSPWLKRLMHKHPAEFEADVGAVTRLQHPEEWYDRWEREREEADRGNTGQMEPETLSEKIAAKKEEIEALYNTYDEGDMPNDLLQAHLLEYQGLVAERLKQYLNPDETTERQEAVGKKKAKLTGTAKVESDIEKLEEQLDIWDSELADLEDEEDAEGNLVNVKDPEGVLRDAIRNNIDAGKERLEQLRMKLVDMDSRAAGFKTKKPTFAEMHPGWFMLPEKIRQSKMMVGLDEALRPKGYRVFDENNPEMKKLLAEGKISISVRDTKSMIGRDDPRRRTLSTEEFPTVPIITLPKTTQYVYAPNGESVLAKRGLEWLPKGWFFAYHGKGNSSTTKTGTYHPIYLGTDVVEKPVMNDKGEIVGKRLFRGDESKPINLTDAVSDEYRNSVLADEGFKEFLKPIVSRDVWGQMTPEQYEQAYRGLDIADLAGNYDTYLARQKEPEGRTGYGQRAIENKSEQWFFKELENVNPNLAAEYKSLLEADRQNLSQEQALRIMNRLKEIETSTNPRFYENLAAIHTKTPKARLDTMQYLDRYSGKFSDTNKSIINDIKNREGGEVFLRMFRKNYAKGSPLTYDKISPQSGLRATLVNVPLTIGDGATVLKPMPLNEQVRTSDGNVGMLQVYDGDRLVAEGESPQLVFNRLYDRANDELHPLMIHGGKYRIQVAPIENRQIPMENPDELFSGVTLDNGVRVPSQYKTKVLPMVDTVRQKLEEVIGKYSNVSTLAGPEADKQRIEAYRAQADMIKENLTFLEYDEAQKNLQSLMDEVYQDAISESDSTNMTKVLEVKDKIHELLYDINAVKAATMFEMNRLEASKKLGPEYVSKIDAVHDRLDTELVDDINDTFHDLQEEIAQKMSAESGEEVDWTDVTAKDIEKYYPHAVRNARILAYADAMKSMPYVPPRDAIYKLWGEDWPTIQAILDKAEYPTIQTRPEDRPYFNKYDYVASTLLGPNTDAYRGNNHLSILGNVRKKAIIDQRTGKRAIAFEDEDGNITYIYSPKTEEIRQERMANSAEGAMDFQDENRLPSEMATKRSRNRRNWADSLRALSRIARRDVGSIKGINDYAKGG